MTEPVAYLVSQEPLSSVRWLSDVRPMGIAKKQITPLYTANQLHPRVKMTKNQLKQFIAWNSESTSPLELIINVIVGHDYPDAFEDKLGNINYEDDYLLSLANIWDDFDVDNPEETIEIVPDMKWFVQKKNFNGEYRFLKVNLKDLSFNHKKDDATRFDTKEGAELWTNPETEAVELPVTSC